MDDRSLFRYQPGYKVIPLKPAFDWSAWGSLGGAVEMCNNNGACRKFDANVMCPSYRVTRDEQHLTRGRANTLRLALSGQLGPDAFTSDAMKETLALCVGCKGCKRECPTGVDMARMKLEFQHHYVRKHGASTRDRLVGHLPYYAPWMARLAPLVNLRNSVPGLARLLEPLTGFTAKRKLPAWRRDIFNPDVPTVGPENGREVVLLADTFNRYFEPENLHAALRVLIAGGYRVHLPRPTDGKSRPLCCGRTLFSAGLTDKARSEQERLRATLLPFVQRGIPVLGLEPSCLFTLRDELPSLLPGEASDQLAEQALLIEEFLAREVETGQLELALRPRPGKALLHGHCHQKAFGTMDAVECCLGLVPELQVETIASSCCGMAGAFGYQRETADISLQMGELSLLPGVREAAPDTLIVADGISCRHQVADGTGRDAMHVVRILVAALQ
jgi:Fe-S oxidoreductase